MMTKVFLLGIDGATWKVLDRFMSEGLMPNLDEITRRGTRGVLNSTIPYLTPVAWSSLLTGVKPSKHCIFGYNVMENREGMIIGLLANRTKIKAPTVMDIFTQLGKKVVSLNMPMTYPPQPKDGTVISGLMTPSRESTYYYPRSLMAELAEQGIDYRIDINIAREVEADLEQRIELYLADGAKRFFEDLRKVTEEREKAVHYLMGSREWDLFQVNFVSMDRIQHYLWNHIWEDDTGSDVVRRIREHYTYLDSLVGRIYSAVKDRAVLIICSDHGFGDYKGNFYPAVWLKQKGYYVERQDDLTPGLMVKRILKALGLSKRVLRVLERSQKTVAKKLIYVGTSQVYWKKTRAYAYGTSGIRINLKGRDQYGIVEPGREYEALRKELTEELMELTDEAGRKVMKAVYPVEELYGVPALQEAPDLFFDFLDDHFYTTYDAITENTVFMDRGYAWRQGDHRRDGVLALAGRGISPGLTIAADIEDVLPTIMFIEDLPQSGDFDGKIIKEAFTEDFIAQRGSKDKRSFERTEVESPDADEGDEVIDRLKGLGYI
jgi:predicted AlkP superfamily phosphohydrolase/phosphomutase